MAVSKAAHAAARAIDDLYRAHAADVYRYALAVLGQPADAEDVTQTTFLNAYRALENGVRPRKPANWLLTIASNVIKQRMRAERIRPRHALLRDPAAQDVSENATPTIGEVLAALGQIPPLQRQAIVLREFEGRPYKEIAEILGVTTSALETLLFRARRSLAEEVESQLSCADAQLAVSRASDVRLGRKERRRLRVHLQECPDCARFARLQQRNRRALRNLALVPVPALEWPFGAVEAPAPVALGVPTATAGIAVAGGGGAGTAAGVLGGTVAVKAAAVVTAASIAGGAAVGGAAKVEEKDKRSATSRIESGERPGKRVGQVAPRGVAVPGRGVALGKTGIVPSAEKRTSPGRRAAAKVKAPSAKHKGVHPPAPRGRKAQAKTKSPPARVRRDPTEKPEKSRADSRARRAPLQPKPDQPSRGAKGLRQLGAPRATSAGAP